jgi:putative oxidoreductase
MLLRNPSNKRRAAINLVRIFLGVIFAYAGGSKLYSSSDFFRALVGYDVGVSNGVLWSIALVLPSFEILCGLALICDRWPETVRSVAAYMCMAFVLVLAQAYLRGLQVECGCFGGRGIANAERLDIALGRAMCLLAASIFLKREGDSEYRRG